VKYRRGVTDIQSAAGRSATTDITVRLRPLVGPEAARLVLPGRDGRGSWNDAAANAFAADADEERLRTHAMANPGGKKQM